MKHSPDQTDVTVIPERAARSGSLAFEQKACSIEQTVKITTLSRSSIFKLIRQGRLKSVLVGRRRLVLVSSVNELLRGAGS